MSINVIIIVRNKISYGQQHTIIVLFLFYHKPPGSYLFRGPLDQTVDPSVSFTIKTNQVSLTEWQGRIQGGARAPPDHQK